MNARELEALGNAIGERLKARGQDLLAGAAEDLTTWAARIAADTVEAVSLGRADLVEALGEQAVALAEVHRLRATAAAWDSLRELVGDVLAGAAGLAARGAA